MNRLSLDFRVIDQGYAGAELGESPSWDPETGALWWVDILGRRVFRSDTVAGETRTWETPECAGFVVLTAPDRPVLGMETGICALDPRAGTFEKLVPFDQPGCRFNDATVDPEGRLWAATMAVDISEGYGGVHRVTPGNGLRTLQRDLTIPNGLAVDQERGRLYFSESLTGSCAIWYQDIGNFPDHPGRPHRFAHTRDLAGRPDGAALDREGNYWIAGVDGGELYVFNADGRLMAAVPVPFREPTKVSFGGTDGRSIAVTSKAGSRDGGFVAIARLPANAPAGIPQPYWNPER